MEKTVIGIEVTKQWLRSTYDDFKRDHQSLVTTLSSENFKIANDVSIFISDMYLKALSKLYERQKELASADENEENQVSTTKHTLNKARKEERKKEKREKKNQKALKTLKKEMNKMHLNELNRKAETEKAIKQVIRNATPDTKQKKRRLEETDESNDINRMKMAENTHVAKTAEKKDPNWTRRVVLVPANNSKSVLGQLEQKLEENKNAGKRRGFRFRHASLLDNVSDFDDNMSGQPSPQKDMT